MDKIYSFVPVANENSRILILGSMPGKESLRKYQYYGHPKNAFWRLMSALLCEPYYDDYQKRTEMLLRYNIALWDVLKSCERKSSLDADIKKAIVNDFTVFFSKYKNIAHTFFNGQMAYNTFKRNVGFEFADITFESLGSTSPAHAISFEKRMEDWKRIVPYIEVKNDDQF